MMNLLVPPGVAVSERRADINVDLFPSERQAIANAISGRRAEFATTRQCARDAMGQLGLLPQAVETGESGEPIWPAPVTGSLTHCAGYRCAVVAPRRKVAALGIDAEPNSPLPPGILEAIAGEAELGRLPDLHDARPSVAWDRLLFSAKEAVYKAVFVMSGDRYTFQDADVSFGDSDCVFDVSLSAADSFTVGRALSGRWLAADGLLLCAITVPIAEVATQGDCVRKLS